MQFYLTFAAVNTTGLVLGLV